MHEPMMGMWGLLCYVLMIAFWAVALVAIVRNRSMGQVMVGTRTAWLSVTGISLGDSEKALRQRGD